MNDLAVFGIYGRLVEGIDSAELRVDVHHLFDHVKWQFYCIKELEQEVKSQREALESIFERWY